MSIKSVDHPQHISILLPTRKRPEFLKNLFNSIETTTEYKNLVDVWLYLDEDDVITKKFVDNSLKNNLYSFDINYVYSSPSTTMGEMYNVMLKACERNPGIYMFCADKITFMTKKWDSIVRETFNSYPDRVLFAHSVDPHMAKTPDAQFGSTYGAYGLFLSAEWINLLGKTYTEYFPFWYDDSWLIQVAEMSQRKIKLDVELDLQGGKGVTIRMRNLVFWDRLFANTIDERIEEAKTLRASIYFENTSQYRLNEELGNKLAQKYIADWKNRTKESLIATEKALADPEQLKLPATLTYLTAELKAANHLYKKAKALMLQGKISEALVIWDNILDACKETKEVLNIDSLQAELQQLSGTNKSLDVVIASIRNLPAGWHIGGALEVDVLEAIVRHVGSRQLLYSVETGSGASTILLSHISKNHKVFSYDCGSNGLTAVRLSPLLNKVNVDFIEGPTQRTLPLYKFDKKIQLALIDGPHGYPFPDLEYYFIYPYLEENALLIIDDIWIPTIYNMFNFLKEDEMFTLIEIVGKTAFFRRTNAPCLNPVGDDWFLQNYNKNRFPLTGFENLSVSQQAKQVKKKALVFFPHNPYPPRTGAHQRCLAMLGGLKKLGYDVTLFGSNLITDNPWPVESTHALQELEQNLGVTVLVYKGSEGDRQFMAQVREQMQANGELVNWDFYTPPNLCESFRQIFTQLQPDLVVINYALWGKLAIGDDFKSAVRIIETHDLITLNSQMQQAMGSYLNTSPIISEQVDPSLIEENFFSKLNLAPLPNEFRVYDEYDYAIVMSPHEAEVIKEHTHHTQAEYVPMTFATEALNNTYSGDPLFAVGPNTFNIQGYLYFVTKILPLVLRQVPEFKLRVVGSSCQHLTQVAGTELLGFVPDLKPLYAEAKFAICPLIGGTGQQVKIVEAMAHGVPVIALSNVAASSPIEHGINGFIAENADEFAKYTIQLFTEPDLCQTLGQAAIKTVADNFSPNLLVEKLREVTEVVNISKTDKPRPRILVDGVFFQIYKTGIARVWKSLLEEWANHGFAKHIVVLDRAETAPKIPGIRYRTIPPYNYNNTDADRAMLQQVCDEEGADLFISTYYTTPISTPSVFMGYDMIPEVMGGDLNHPMWQEKHRAIQHAVSYITISQHTARDLIKFFPDISSDLVTVALCGVQSQFSPAPSEQINQFKTKYGISKPYFLLVGTGGYKNTELFLQAFAQLYSKQSFEIVCTGGASLLTDDQWRSYTAGSVVHILQLSDEELRAAYSGAIALVYPSKYEGFGLPVLEALACGCPVITCPNASIPEVAGEAALYVKDDDVNGLANALCEVQKPHVRKSLIAAGLEQAKKFSWSKMAETVSSALINATLLPLKLTEINLIIFPDWSQSEESLGMELSQVIRAIAHHPDKNRMTLLIDTSNITDEENANLFLSSIAMNLLMEEDIDVTEGLEISLVGQLGEIQWSALLPRIQSRIVLENENKEAIAIAKAENLPLRQLDSMN